ncbi:MAG: hypothetical protein K0U71_03410 [Actinomycetia bacterium]|nr:hypothetical protein [Actinomycetes bacterium]
MTSECRACRAGLEHCHGALIHHDYRRPECTADECDSPDGEHAVHIDCGTVGCACDAAVAAAVGTELAHRVS